MKGLILFLLSLNTLACLSVTAPKNLNISISPLSKSLFVYDENGVAKESMPEINAVDCLATAKNKHYTMFTVGIENYILTDQFLTYSINDRITYGSKDFCRIENLDDTQGTLKDDREQRLLKRRRVMNRCLTFEVKDRSKTGIEFPESQPGCRVERVDENTARFEGYFCFFKPKMDSALSLTPVISPKCLTNEFYKENQFELQDILASIGVYISGDATGRSSVLQYINDVKLRLNQSPENIIPVNKTVNPNAPKFPTNWRVKDINLGKIQIQQSKDTNLFLGVPLFVRNSCEKSCNDGLCSSSCNYTQPVTAEFVLSEIEEKRNKKHYITSWFDGGVSPANWTGLITGIGTNITSSYIQEGKMYELEALLDDQEYNFMMFKGRIKSRLTLRPITIPRIRREGKSLSALNPFAKIETLKTLPTFPVFDTIRFTGNSHVGVKNTVNSISRVFEDPIWPPYFNNYCADNTCVLMKEHKLRLKLKFKVVKNKDTEKLEAADISYEKISNIEDNKVVNKYEAPYFTCTPPGQDPTDDNDDDDFGDIDF